VNSPVRQEHAPNQKLEHDLAAKVVSTFADHALSAGLELPGYSPMPVIEEMCGGETGWGGRDRTSEWRNQNPLPYRLATPQQGAPL